MPPTLSGHLLTTQVIADRAIATLYDTCVMAQLVHRDFDRYFVPGVGNKVTIRKPVVFEAKEYSRATGIVLQEPEEGKIDVTLNHFADVSFPVTSEDWTLEIENFADQLLNPAMEAIVQKVDKDILLLAEDEDIVDIGAASPTSGAGGGLPGGQGSGYSAYDSRILIEAGKLLTRANVPRDQRAAVVPPELAAAWVGEDTWRHADKRGSTEGLTEAQLGARVHGFTPYETTGIADGAPGLAFHRDALALVTRPLAIPRGAKEAAISSYKGLGLRVIYDYDPNKKQDVVSIDILYGTQVLEPERAVRLGA